jgi:hypothetical protein
MNRSSPAPDPDVVGIDARLRCLEVAAGSRRRLRRCLAFKYNYEGCNQRPSKGVFRISRIFLRLLDVGEQLQKVLTPIFVGRELEQTAITLKISAPNEFVHDASWLPYGQDGSALGCGRPHPAALSVMSLFYWEGGCDCLPARRLMNRSVAGSVDSSLSELERADSNSKWDYPGLWRHWSFRYAATGTRCRKSPGREVAKAFLCMRRQIPTRAGRRPGRNSAWARCAFWGECRSAPD